MTDRRPGRVVEVRLVGHGLRGAWEPFARGLLGLLRWLARQVMGGMVATGAAWYGGPEAYAAWQDSEARQRSPAAPAPRSRRQVSREAAAGMQQIEAFLAARDLGPPSAGPAPERRDIHPSQHEDPASRPSSEGDQPTR